MSSDDGPKMVARETVAGGFHVMWTYKEGKHVDVSEEVAHRFIGPKTTPTLWIHTEFGHYVYKEMIFLLP